MQELLLSRLYFFFQSVNGVIKDVHVSLVQPITTQQKSLLFQAGWEYGRQFEIKPGEMLV